MQKSLSSEEAIKAALPEIAQGVAKEIAARIANGELIDSVEEISFKSGVAEQKQRWIAQMSEIHEDAQTESRRKKRAA